MEIWHSRAMRVSPDPFTDGGSYYTSYPWRQVLHTTEGGPNYTPSTKSYFGHSYWPHATAARVNGVARIVQHLPISRAAKAMENDAGGVQTNRGHAVQLEIGWYADRIQDLPGDIAAVVRDWVLWVSAQTSTPVTGPTFYGQDSGFTLASETARQRMSFDQWTRFTGICGHQHVPENVHWDPGKLDLVKLVGNSPSQPQPEDDLMNLIAVPWLTAFPKPAWKVTPGPIDGSSFSIVSFDGAPLDRIPVLRSGGVQDGGPFRDGQTDAKGRKVDWIAYGLWVRNVYDTVGNYQGFVEVNADTIAVMTGIGHQYVIGRK